MDKRFIIVNVGSTPLRFSVGDEDVNKYLNDQLPHEKVSSAYNLLMRTVVEEDKDQLKKLALVGDTPRGIVVIQLATIIASEFGGNLEIAIKKPSSGSAESSKTATAS